MTGMLVMITRYLLYYRQFTTMDANTKATETDDKVERMVKRLSEARDNIGKMAKKVKVQNHEVHKQIDQHYDELVETLMKQKNQVKQKVQSRVSQKLKALAARCDKVELAQVELEGLKMKNNSLKMASKDDVSYAYQKELVNKWFIKFESSCERDLKPAEMDKIEFIPSTSDKLDFGHLSAGPLSANFDHEVLLPEHVCINKKAKAMLFKGSKFVKGVSVQLETSTGEVVVAEVQDNNDGSYTASFISKQVGMAKLIVFVDGKEIAGSPYSIEIYRNYEDIDLPSKVLKDPGIIGTPRAIACSFRSVWAVIDQNQVYIYDGQDQLVKKIKKYKGNEVMLNYCKGIAFDADDYLYVTDCNCIKKFDLHGKFLLQFEGSDSNDGQLQNPRGITTHRGKVYVTESRGHSHNYTQKGYIFVFQCDGQFCNSFSSHLSSAYDVAVNTNNQLLVADFVGNRICIFSLDGQYVNYFTLSISFGLDMTHPNSISTDKNGFIFVADSKFRIIVFDKSGNFIHSFTNSPGNHKGLYDERYSVSINQDGKIYVLDNSTRAVLIFYDF